MRPESTRGWDAANYMEVVQYLNTSVTDIGGDTGGVLKDCGRGCKLF